MRGFAYKGYVYAPWDDRDDDCTKIWHEFRGPNGETVTCDWSPYALMTRDDIKLWFDLGMPERLGGCPLDRQDLLQIQREQIDVMNAIANSNFNFAD